MAAHKTNLAISIPEWLKIANPKSSLGVKDLSVLFKVSENCIYNLLARGDLPSADFEPPCTYREHANRPLKWSARTIRNFIRRQHA